MMKRISYLFFIVFLGFTLTACIGEVSKENEAEFGTFAPSLEGEEADNFIRGVVDFQKIASSTEVQFRYGYTVQSAQSSLFAGVYEYINDKNATENMAKILQNELQDEQGWRLDQYKSDNDENITIYNIIDEISGKESTAAVKVESNSFDESYWIYIAIPHWVITDKDHPNVKKEFKKHRESK